MIAKMHTKTNIQKVMNNILDKTTVSVYKHGHCIRHIFFKTPATEIRKIDFFFKEMLKSNNAELILM